VIGASARRPWWNDAVVYQIYPRSFCDTTGNGVGDLEGIRRRLDHIVDLGVDALWLSPMFRSPMADHGYDVADYCDVDPLFGSLEDIDRLVAEAHDRGLKVLLDWVPNHTSDQHPWFLASRSSVGDSKRNWYVWRDGRGVDGSEPPNDWTATFPPGPAWSRDDASGQWYLHLFTPEQPDLDWRNPDVVEAMHDTLRFWLDRGVDGFRMDVIHMIGKDPDGPGREPRSGELEGVGDEPLTHELLRGIRTVLDGYGGDRVAIGEVFILNPETVARFYGHDDELHLAFYFTPQFTPFRAPDWRAQISEVAHHFDPRGAWPVWVLNNHDIPRFPTRTGGGDARAKAAALLLLTLRGTPFLYAGEELGLEDADVPEHWRQDPAGFRDGCRAPIPWDASEAHGWATAETWLPWPPDATTRSSASQAGDPSSILNLYRSLIAARKVSPALREGDLDLLDVDDERVLSYRRHVQGDERVIMINMSEDDLTVSLAGRWSIEIGTNGPAPNTPFTGALAPDEAVLLTSNSMR
jgi:alpha-glucosidase